MKRLPARFSPESLAGLFSDSAMPGAAGDRVEFLSRQFLGIPYQESTLTGSETEKEVLVINLRAVDCFTLLDYVEALRRSPSPDVFRTNLIKTRYRDGLVSFVNRNHFFTDWIGNNAGFVRDVTGETGGGSSLTVTKTLNLKEDCSLFIRGVSPVTRGIVYIPSGLIDGGVSELLCTGDYAGIYADIPGLDVSHAGIIIRRGEDLILRHASSVHRKVLDEDFRTYMAGKPGLVLLRPGLPGGSAG